MKEVGHTMSPTMLGIVIKPCTRFGGRYLLLVCVSASVRYLQKSNRAARFLTCDFLLVLNGNLCPNSSPFWGVSV